MTHPAIIKMLYLGPKKDKISFAAVIKNCHIMPVAISYEDDPNTINKAREEVATALKGEYNKRPMEDVISMVKGLREWKGNVHLSFGDVIDGEYNSAEDVAAEVDRQIHSIYRLWPNNWFSYDYLKGSDEHRAEYEGFDSDAFLSSIKHLSPEVKSFVLNSYANPVRARLGEV